MSRKMLTTTVPKNKHYPSMTARDFQLIADVLASIEAERPVKETVIAAFAEELAHTNPNFRPDLFRAACKGIVPGMREVRR